jgi:hypothetical protein
MYYAIAWGAAIVVILLWIRGAHMDDMDDPTLSQIKRWQLRAGELRKVLALLPPENPAHPEIAKKRAKIASQLRRCETRAFNLLQGDLFNARRTDISDR